jgi:hypothetical protein
MWEYEVEEYTWGTKAYFKKWLNEHKLTKAGGEIISITRAPEGDSKSVNMMVVWKVAKTAKPPQQQPPPFGAYPSRP